MMLRNIFHAVHLADAELKLKLHAWPLKRAIQQLLV